MRGALWKFIITPDMLYVRMHEAHDGNPTTLYVALLLPVDAMTSSVLRIFPAAIGSGRISPHISIVYNAVMPSEDGETHWRTFWELQLRMARWLHGPTSMIICDADVRRLTVSGSCRLHAQLRLARQEVIGHMGLQERENHAEDTNARETWDDFHVTCVPRSAFY